MSEVLRNPLSCTRCKSKKIKCGREEPRCDKCTATKAECSYPIRRHKTRNSKKRPDILSQILQRLDTLERNAGISSRTAHPANDTTSHDGNERSMLGDDDDGASSTEAVEASSGKRLDSLYQLMNEAANTSKDVFGSVPEAVPSEQDADTLFKDSLTSIRTFRWKDESSERLHIPDKLARKWVQSCFEVTFYEQIVGAENKPLIMAMPDIMKSPVIHVNYSVVVVYYNALYCGWRSDESLSTAELRDYGRKIYRECLRLLPDWKNDGLPANIMDTIALGLMTIMAIENFDYHLGWDLHVACCEIVRELKLDYLDDPDPSNRPTGYDDEAERNLARKRFWQLIHLEFFFRLYYEKPATMTATDFSVNLPSMDTASGSAHAVDDIYFIVNSRIVFITKEFFDATENPTQGMQSRVGELADQIENVLHEWNVHNLLTEVAPTENISDRWMYADLLVNGYITIILMDRKASGASSKPKSDPNTTPPSSRCVHAARKTLETMNILLKLFGHHSPTFMNFISFYPFVAFFTLYHHILFTLQRRPKSKSSPQIETDIDRESINTQRDTMERDISLMEDLATLLGSLASSQEEFRLVANAVTTLTKASRKLLSASLPATPATAMSTTTPTSAPISNLNVTHNPSDSRTLRKRTSKPVEPMAIGLDHASSPPEDLAFPWGTGEGTAWSWSQFEAGMQSNGLQTPLLLMESMESDLFGRNWHQSWWDQ